MPGRGGGTVRALLVAPKKKIFDSKGEVVLLSVT